MRLLVKKTQLSMMTFNKIDYIQYGSIQHQHHSMFDMFDVGSNSRVTHLLTHSYTSLKKKKKKKTQNLRASTQHFFKRYQHISHYIFIEIRADGLITA